MDVEERRSGSLVARVETLLWGRSRHGPLVGVLRVIAVALWKFDRDKCFLRASALTYTSLLSLVPLLALMFSVLKGLGVQRRLEPLLLQHIAMGNEELVTQIIEYVDRTRIGALGAVGLVALIFTAVSVLGNVELSLNDIWQVHRGRNLMRKVADYIALLVVGPILLLASISLTTSLQSSQVLETLSLVGPAVPYLMQALPFLAICIAFTAAYMILPNRRVPPVSALIGGMAGGLLWQIAEGGYIRFQFGMAKYNAIYGALAQLPMLLVWVYVSWCIVLFGAQLAFVHQLPEKGRFLKQDQELWTPRLDGALAILVAVARRFERAEPPPTETALAAELGLNPAEAARIFERLEEVQLLRATQEDPPGFVPARAPDRTPVAALLEAVSGHSRLERLDPELAARVRASLDREFADLSWADLALRQDP